MSDEKPGDGGQEPREKPMFAHQPWMVGMVLVFGVVAILAGLVNPVWFLIGAPCILVLAVYIYVRIVGRNQAGDPYDPGEDG